MTCLFMKVNIYDNQDVLRPIGNPPLGGEQVAIIKFKEIMSCVITLDWSILWVFNGSS